MRLNRVLLYAGVGFLLHLAFVGTHIDYVSAESLAWILAWPVMLFVQFWKAVMIILAAVGLVVMILVLVAIEDSRR